MFNKIFNKIKLFYQKPKVIIITSNNQRREVMIKGFIYQILGNSFKINKEILIVNSWKKINLSEKKYLILDFDNEDIRTLIGKAMAKILTFGFQDGADLRATDINLNYISRGVNFKINYQGNVVPIWLEKYLGEEQIYAALAAISVGIIFGLNLVEISQALKTLDKYKKIS